MPYSDLAAIPRDNVGEIQRAEWRAVNAELYAKTNALPSDSTGKAGEIAAVNDAETGVAAASDGGTDALTFAQRRVRGYRYDPVAVSASMNITDQHCGQQLQCSSGSLIQLNVLLDGDPTVGVSDGFACEVLHLHDGDELQLLFSGVANREPSGNTRVPPGCAVRIQIIGTDCYVFGTTEP